MPLQPGRLRYRLAFQSPTETANEYGEVERTWSTYVTLWGSIEPVSSLRITEMMAGNQPIGKLSHRVWIRYNSSITIKHRISFDDRIFEINAIINPQERNEYLELMCKEVI